METASFFNIFVTGQIESVNFPLGPDGSQVFCRYEIISGPDWELVSGVKTGITQCSTPKSTNQEIVFNMPIEVSFKTTNPFGWPQIIVSVYGKNLWGAETSLGYARAHLPVFGSGKQRITTPIIIPRCAHLVAELASWVTGKNPELKNPDILCDGTKNKGLQIETYGELILSLQTISRGSGHMGFDWGQGGND